MNLLIDEYIDEINTSWSSHLSRALPAGDKAFNPWAFWQGTSYPNPNAYILPFFHKSSCFSKVCIAESFQKAKN
jgi:hypothetical protein